MSHRLTLITPRNSNNNISDCFTIPTPGRTSTPSRGDMRGWGWTRIVCRHVTQNKTKAKISSIVKGWTPSLCYAMMPSHPRSNNIFPTQNNAHNVLIFAHVHMSPVVDVQLWFPGTKSGDICREKIQPKIQLNFLSVPRTYSFRVLIKH